MQGRPAESVTGVTAIGLLVAIILGVDDADTIAAMVGALGVLPGAVTLLVANGGIRGVLRLVYRGREER
jgi:predicted amino acid dehydrogenase